MLRGINVSGQKKILMADLKKLYEGLGFKDVVTYIQSGNVLFKTSGKSTDVQLGKKIHEALKKQYSFEVPIIIRTLEEMHTVQKDNPFLKKKGVNMERLYVTFLSEEAPPDLIEKIMTFEHPTDEFVIIGKEVYLYCPGGYGETKLSNNFFESKLKVVATTRNWNTVNILTGMAEGH